MAPEISAAQSNFCIARKDTKISVGYFVHEINI